MTQEYHLKSKYILFAFISIISLMGCMNPIVNVPETYTISYDANGADSGSVPAEQQKTEGNEVTLADNTGNLVKAGNTFVGWNTAADGTGTQYAVNSTFSEDANLELFARWSLIPTYTVSYDANGADSGTVPSDQIKIQDEALTLSENTGNLAKTGETFVGWNTAPDGNGTYYSESASYTANADVTLFAEWTALPTYTITYNANGADSGSVPSSQTKIQGIDLTLASNTGSLSKTGYAFAGWNTASNGSGTSYSEGAPYTSNADITLFAEWTALPTYTISYNDNGADSGSVPSDQTKIEGINITLASNNGSLFKAGFEFIGWNSSPDSMGTMYVEDASFTNDVDTILFADWRSAVSIERQEKFHFNRYTDHIGSDGHFYTIQSTSSDASFRKISENDGLQFEITYSNDPNDVHIHGITTDLNGNIYLIGYQKGLKAYYSYGDSSIQIPRLLSGATPVISKYSPSGDILWARTIEGVTGSNYGNVTFHDIEIASDGSIYLTARLGGYNTTDFTIDFGNDIIVSPRPEADIEPFLIKLDEQGNTIWATGVSDTVGYEVDGMYRAYFGELAIDSSNNPIIDVMIEFNPLGTSAGSKQLIFNNDISTSAFNVGYMDNRSFLLKYDNSGNAQWIRHVNDSSTASVRVDSLNNIFIESLLTGSVMSSKIEKYSPQGLLLWSPSISTQSGQVEIQDFFLDLNGNLYFGGRLQNVADYQFENGITISTNTFFTAFLVKYNSLGEMEYVRVPEQSSSSTQFFAPIYTNSLGNLVLWLDQDDYTISVTYGPGVSSIPASLAEVNDTDLRIEFYP
jgi:uncharacterized repeat protein (TIGR02543 family)